MENIVTQQQLEVVTNLVEKYLPQQKGVSVSSVCAPEVGINYRVGVIKTDTKKFVIVNPEVKIKSDVFDDLITILKDYFDEEYHEELRELLVSGKKLNRKLVFNGSAIQLTDVFKQLKENQMIVGCNKQYLENWLVNNFMFNKKGNISEFNHQSTHKSISGNNYPCKKPIIQIGSGKLCRF